MVSARLEKKVEGLASDMAAVGGVAAIFLFGSFARGEATKGSDVDILVLFKDERSLWRGRKELFRKASETDVFVQVLARTVDEFWNRTDQTFREEVLSGGRLLYLNGPMTATFESLTIVTFDLQSLHQSGKMRVRNGLHKLIAAGGRRLGRGCVLLRREQVPEAENVLRSSKAPYQLIPVFLPSIQGNRPVHARSASH